MLDNTSSTRIALMSKSNQIRETYIPHINNTLRASNSSSFGNLILGIFQKTISDQPRSDCPFTSDNIQVNVLLFLMENLHLIINLLNEIFLQIRKNRRYTTKKHFYSHQISLFLKLPQDDYKRDK